MKLKNIFKRFKKQIAITAAAAVIAVPVIAAANWGPGRPVFDYNNPKDRIGSTTGPVFDSFINTPSYGDERNFVRVSTDNGAHWIEKASVKPGQEVMVRAYVHNNANQDLNGSNFTGISVARNTRIRFFVPSGQSTGFDVAGYISADNAKPTRVFDTATITDASQPVQLNYVAGSAKLYNNGPFKNGTKVSDSAVSATGNGALIGFNSMNGIFPGCFNFEAVVIIKLKVAAPKLQFTKQVTTPGSSVWHKNISAKGGDTVSWLLTYKNIGNAVMKNITIRDVMPANATLVPGSITWFDPNHPSGKQEPDTILNAGGANVGNYAPGVGGFIRFRTVINKNPTICTVNNVAFARATQIPEISSKASVTVNDCHPTLPTFSCDLLSATVDKHNNHKYNFQVNASAAGGATIKMYSYDFGDGSDKFVTDKTAVSHTYKKAGDFVAKVTVTVDVKGSTQQTTSESCQVTIHIPNKPPKPPVTPPEQLVNTGPGDVIGIFAATTIAGAMFHKLFLAKRGARF